jgi:hypothetical protein
MGLWLASNVTMTFANPFLLSNEYAIVSPAASKVPPRSLNLSLAHEIVSSTESLEPLSEHPAMRAIEVMNDASSAEEMPHVLLRPRRLAAWLDLSAGCTHLSFVNKLLRHTPRSSSVIRFASGERLLITIAPSGIVVEKLWLRIFRRRLFAWSRSDPKRLDKAVVFFMSGPASDLPGDSVLELIVTRLLRECDSVADVTRLCAQLT